MVRAFSISGRLERVTKTKQRLVITISRDISFTFRKGGPTFLDVMNGTIIFRPTRLNRLDPPLVLPEDQSFYFADGIGTATNIEPTPAVDSSGNPPWAYLVIVNGENGNGWEFLVGVPEGEGSIFFSVLPRYFVNPMPKPGNGTGTPGPRGEKGEKGDIGPQGLQGIQGAQGLNGNTGETGATGAQGLQGIKGDQGEPGVQGIQGLQGAKGDVGAQGTAGLQGAQGLPGVRGLQGVTGEKGDQGIAGPQGIRGVQGDQGLKGDTGTQGIQGPKGDTGSQGLQGIQGAAGSTGSAGTITSVSASGLAAGASPTVTAGGTASARTFAFGIPAGAQGLQGLQGVAGASGVITPGAWFDINVSPPSLNGGAGGTGLVRVRAYGRLREIRYDVSGTCPGEVTLVTLGTGDRPDGDAVGSESQSGGTGVNPMYVRSDGTLRLPYQPTTTRRVGHMLYVQGS